MDQSRFQSLLSPVFDLVTDMPLGPDLEQALNKKFPAEEGLFNEIEQACKAAIHAGWMCNQGQEGRRFGRVIEASDQTSQLSVDVVDLKNIVGPHHRHPLGEVCMIMPGTDGARFDGKGAGWCVYKPGSAHFPTVSSGQALVLYLLPEGQIEFTGQKPPA